MRRLIYLLPVLLFGVLAGYFALALRPGYDPQTLPSAMIDKPAPDFDLAALQGDAKLSRDGLIGKPIVVNFFASWCVPCRIEHPLLMRLSQQEHIPLYGIDYKDKPEDAQRLLTQLGDPYRLIGMDREGHVGLDFGVYGVPETYVIDKTGRIRKRFVGPLSAEQVDQELLPLLRQLSAS
ncbi:MAG: DsbE family thiol:disulfide interchange protein [Acetobacteraceae bacterium]|nr:DsbE family thiol:disulfide interchange protein [Acetobacteraceae bacterium]